MQFLRTQGRNIIDEDGSIIFLRGTCVGGWLNLEDFINGYPGTATTLKGHMEKTIGKELSDYFFDKMADYFFTEADIAHMASLGANVLRIPLNYRDFEDDDRPFEYKMEGFKRLDEALKWCEKYKIYAILDMHAAAGWQNNHWHCDNERGASMLWRHPHFQDRLVGFWELVAKRYKDNPVVAGYEVLNEPNSGCPDGEHPFDFYGNYKPDWDRMNALYRRVVAAIRAIDKKHMIFLEGDNYGRYFSGLDAPMDDNLVYSSHNYVAPGFGPGEYPGYFHSPDGLNYWDINRQRVELLKHEGMKYSLKYDVPLLIGEFGSQYNGPADDVPYRLQSMKDQLAVYNENGIHWTTWTYKDAGVMGWMTLAPDSEYSLIIHHIQEAKRHLGAENFVAIHKPSAGRAKAFELSEMIRESSMMPFNLPNDTAYTFNYAALTGFAAAMLQPAYAQRFRFMSKADIDRVLSSFAWDNCVPNVALEKILKVAMS